MKCVPFEEKRLAKWEPPYIVQPKYNGVRCRAVHTETGGYILLSSEENIMYSVPHLNAIFDSIGLRAEFDGELYYHGMSFEQILSITSRTVNLSDDSTKIQFHLFDIINDQPQMRRSLIIENLRGVHSHIRVAPFWLCEDLDAVKRVYDEIIKQGYEGIIIRHHNNPYERKRSTLVMKFKPKAQDTYTIVDWQEEVSKDGVPKGRIGALIMQSQTGDRFGVSAGLNDSEKASLWNSRHELAGKVAVVHYQNLTDKGLPRGCFDLEVIYG